MVSILACQLVYCKHVTTEAKRNIRGSRGILTVKNYSNTPNSFFADLTGPGAIQEKKAI